MKLSPEERFDFAEGLYWYCAHNHCGQCSELYEIMCKLEYKPSPLHNSPTSEASERIYADLEDRLLNPSDVLKEIKDSYDNQA